MTIATGTAVDRAADRAHQVVGAGLERAADAHLGDDHRRQHRPERQRACPNNWAATSARTAARVTRRRAPDAPAARLHPGPKPSPDDFCMFHSGQRRISCPKCSLIGARAKRLPPPSRQPTCRRGAFVWPEISRAKGKHEIRTDSSSPSWSAAWPSRRPPSPPSLCRLGPDPRRAILPKPGRPAAFGGVGAVPVARDARLRMGRADACQAARPRRRRGARVLPERRPAAGERRAIAPASTRRSMRAASF